MTLASGARIGPYEILAPLGTGGMGEVYRARDARLDRTVAVKVLTSSRGVGQAHRDRFEREARAIARLSHPHICTLHDVGDQDGVAFLVMEFLEGETLAGRLERGPLPTRDALEVAIQIADALDAAHRRGVIHRDLKPSNVMLTPAGVKLLDFGLAKLRDAEYEDILRAPTASASLTDSGTMLGTLPYMAPEQLDGREIDARTDLFSFGVLLYEMIAGRRPFESDSRVSLMAAIVTGEPPALSDLQPATPGAVARLIDRCLAKHADDRWQTARDLGAELRWIHEGGSSGIAPARAARPSRRVLMVGAMAMAVGAAGALAFAALLRSPTTIPEFQQVTFRRGVVSSARFTPDGQSFVYSASWEGQPYGVFLGRSESPDARSLDLEAGRILSISRAGNLAVLFGPQNIQRAFGTRMLSRIPLAGGVRRDLLTGVVDADWIPGADALAVVRDPGGGRAWTVEFPLGTVVHELRVDPSERNSPRAAWSLRVSPDGNRVAFFEGPDLFGGAPLARVTVIDRAGRKTTLTRNWSGLGLAWAPSGNEIWFTATHGSVADPERPPTGESRAGAPWVSAVSLSGVERTVHRAPDWLVLHDIAADGRALLSRNTIRISTSCQAPGEARERDLSWQLASVVSGLSRDSSRLIFFDTLGGRTLGGAPTVFRRSLDAADAVPLGEGTEATESPDGKWVLSLRTGSLVLLPTGAGAEVTLPKGDLTQVAAGAWFPDSTRIVFGGRRGTDGPRIYVQDITGGNPRAITPEGIGYSPRAAVHDETSVLARSGDQWLLYPVAGGDPRPVPTLAAQDRPVQWSGDGRFVYYVVTPPDGVRSPGFDVFRLELATGNRVLWKTLAPADPVGVEVQDQRVVLTPDARSYCYSYMRRLGDLFILSGLR